MSFWDVVWFIIISFAFIAYLMMVFAIIGDLFRDREASGIAKALWFLALIFLPFLTALVYLIVKGNGMAERQQRSADSLRAQQEAYIREVSASVTPTSQIAQAQAMLDSGAISRQEFETLKAKALS